MLMDATARLQKKKRKRKADAKKIHIYIDITTYFFLKLSIFFGHYLCAGKSDGCYSAPPEKDG